MAKKAKQSLPSVRSFGLVFTGFFALVGLWPVVIHGAPPHWWAIVVAVAFAGCTALWPQALRPINFVWYKFGMALHHIVNPILMGLIYFGAVVPMSLMMRLKGRDPLRMKRDTAADSYWIQRQPPLPTASLHKQF